MKSYLISLIPNTQNTEEILKKILAKLYSMKLTKKIDHESLAHDIWLEAWTNQIPVTSQFILHRAINSLNRTKKEVAHFDSHTDPFTSEEFIMTPVQESHSKENEIFSEFDSLMSRVTLTFDQLKVIHMIYYTGKTLSEISETLHKPKEEVRHLLHLAIEKLQAAARGMK